MYLRFSQIQTGSNLYIKAQKPPPPTNFWLYLYMQTLSLIRILGVFQLENMDYNSTEDSIL